MADAVGFKTLPYEAARDALGKLVAELPEIYQPIFDHPELSACASRTCGDRLVHIAQICRNLEAKLKRPLRVLDLGCAQGFFSFSLARLGARVHGVDFQPRNIAVCRALAAENPELEVTFQTGQIEAISDTLAQGAYDLVLGLSVFHHIVHERGIEVVTAMLSGIAEKTVAGIFEMALASEPVHWASSQPQNPRQLLGRYAFVHELAESGTHLSAVRRPLYIASNHYWFLDGRAESFDTWKSEPHALGNSARNGTRRYFFGNRLVMKLFRLDDSEYCDANVQDHRNEVTFLQSPPPDLKTPRLVLHGLHERECWLVREQLPGELLLDHIRFGKPYDVTLVLQDVLNQLASLETAKLYHEDLRTWNILIDPDGRATLIDYGSITGAAKDCLWPHNIFLAFMIFVHGILPGSAATRVRLRSPALCPDEFPEPYRSVFWEFLKLRPDQWRFAFLRDRFLQAQSAHSNSAEPPPNGLALALQAMGEACNTYHETIQQIVTRNQQADAGWQRSVSVAHNNIGDMQRAQGDLPAALRSYQAAHDILSRLAQSDPASAEWQRDLAFGYGRVGVVQSEQGARDDARGALRHGRDIIARLMRQSPDSFTLPKDIAWFDTQLATLD